MSVVLLSNVAFDISDLTSTVMNLAIATIKLLYYITGNFTVVDFKWVIIAKNFKSSLPLFVITRFIVAPKCTSLIF